MADSYVLGNRKSEIERLDIQASFFEPFSRDALLKAGIRRGMDCADVGSGSGSVTRLMAQMVGKEGHVTGVDIDDNYLQYCRTVNTFPNVDFIHQDIISSLQEKSDKFDLAFSRFMFVHLKDPKQAVKAMKGMVRDGGTVVIQELDHSPDSWLSHPHEECVDTLREAFVTLVRKSGGDPLAGRKLYKMAVEESLHASVECYAPCLMMGNEPLCSLGWRIADSLKPAILQHGVMKESEYERMFSDLKQLSKKKDSFVTYARFFSVIGKKDGG
ncbi:methylase involved in ubiquinone/menaquinone biosynthesis [Candidatus Nitrososphaera evergladensis SR1]|uniref:Methylase involved in ubiquinone/menaquinone biosynthesis n=1 Tax=Candidatus Nitrososphaera evergladensis SR1 TaxID=1459636 RepID=A0A075MUC6_9ARCH|nr:class I SAM-dependent methyltransferase [Candidatus Nitrososphaera evergladensis]AIF82939.1 methylase involved in ubiquinone/menaquinone biosynthesis [Candidatus Nitrososphaera evergladensis SR1]